MRRKKTDRESHGAPSRRVNAPMPLRGGKGRARRRVSWLADRRVHPGPSHEESILRSGCRPIRLGDAAPRLQWRHRVGFAPTSRDRRAEPVNASHRLDVSCPASIRSRRQHLAPCEPGAWHLWHIATLARSGTLAPWHLGTLAPWHPWHLATLAPSPVGCKMKCLQVLSASIQADRPAAAARTRPGLREIDDQEFRCQCAGSPPSRAVVNGRRFRRARRHADGPDRRAHRADRRHRPDRRDCGWIRGPRGHRQPLVDAHDVCRLHERVAAGAPRRHQAAARADGGRATPTGCTTIPSTPTAIASTRMRTCARCCSATACRSGQRRQSSCSGSGSASSSRSSTVRARARSASR